MRVQLVWQFVKMEKSRWDEEESNVDGREKKDFSGKRFVHFWKCCKLDFTFDSYIKLGCVFPVVVVSILPQAEFGRNDHKEDTLQFSSIENGCS